MLSVADPDILKFSLSHYSLSVDDFIGTLEYPRNLFIQRLAIVEYSTR
jgi:hypothetical protein